MAAWRQSQKWFTDHIPDATSSIHKELIAELAPNGRLEYEIVETIARLIFRKRNLWTYGLAEIARRRYVAIKSEREKWRLSRPTKLTKRQQIIRDATMADVEKQKTGESFSDEEIQRMQKELDDPEVKQEEKFERLWREIREFPQYKQGSEEQKLEKEHIRRELGANVLALAETGHVTTTGYLLHELSIIDRIDGMIDRNLKRLLLLRGMKSISPSLSPAPKRIAVSGSADSREKLLATAG